MKYVSIMDRMIMALQNTGDVMLRYQFQKDMMRESQLSKREHDQLISETAEEVLSRLHATVDVTEIIEKIEELEKLLNKLGK